jgi:hypothetical protein
VSSAALDWTQALGLESPGAFDFTELTGHRDALHLGDCDAAVTGEVAISIAEIHFWFR